MFINTGSLLKAGHENEIEHEELIYAWFKTNRVKRKKISSWLIRLAAAACGHGRRPTCSMFLVGTLVARMLLSNQLDSATFSVWSFSRELSSAVSAYAALGSTVGQWAATESLSLCGICISFRRLFMQGCEQVRQDLFHQSNTVHLIDRQAVACLGSNEFLPEINSPFTRVGRLVLSTDCSPQSSVRDQGQKSMSSGQRLVFFVENSTSSC